MAARRKLPSSLTVACPRPSASSSCASLAWVPLVFLCWYLLVPVYALAHSLVPVGHGAAGCTEFVTSVQQTLHGFEFLTNLSPGVTPGQVFPMPR